MSQKKTSTPRLSIDRELNPCVGICSTRALGDTICKGCGRTDTQVNEWLPYTDEKKRLISRSLYQIDGKWVPF